MNEIAEYKIEPYHDLSDAVTTIERIAKVEQLTGWQLAYAVHQAVKQFGQTVYGDVSQQIGRKEKTLRNLVSAIRNPLAEEAFQAGLTINEFLEIAPIARDLPDAASHYIAEASEKAMTVDEIRRMVHTPTAENTEFTTSGTVPPVAVSAETVLGEMVTGVWIRRDMQPVTVWDELTRIFDEEWIMRFYRLVSKGAIDNVAEN